MSIARRRRDRVRSGLAIAAFLLASGISAGDGAAPDDPLLPFSTQLGGSRIDEAVAEAIGPDGAVWIAATTASDDFPGAPRVPPSVSGDTDVVVLRLDSSTHEVLSAARLGGSMNEVPVAIAVDAAGNAYVAGMTWSPDFPLTSGSVDDTPGANQIFVARVLRDGSGFAWAHEFGDLGGVESLAGMCLTADGDPVVVGTARGAGFPLASALFPHWRGGATDVFVARLSAGGTGFVFSTLLGGNDEDAAVAVCRAPNGTLVVAGRTSSSDFLTTGTRLVGEPGGRWLGHEGFLAELSATGTQLVRVVGLGATEIAAITATPDSLVLAGYAVDGMPFPPPRPPADSERFGLLLRLDGVTWNVEGGAFLGGSRSQYISSVAVGRDETVWIAGSTEGSPGLPVPGAVHPLPASPTDAYVAAFDPSDFRQILGTCLGGNWNDRANAVVVAADGSAWVAGGSSSTDFPLVHALQPAFDSTAVHSSELFVSVLLAGDPAIRPAAVVAPAAAALDGHSVRVSWTPGDSAATAFAIDRSELSPATVGWTRAVVLPADAREWIDTAVRVERTYRYSVLAFNAGGGSPPSVPVVATTPATLGLSIRQAEAAYWWGRPPRARRRGDMLRIRGTLLRSDDAGGPIDPVKDGLVLIAGDADDGQWLLQIDAGESANWRVARNGVQRRRTAATRMEFDPATGAFDLRVDTGLGITLQSVTDPAFGLTALRLEVGHDAGSVLPLWRPVKRRGVRVHGGLVGVRLP